MTLGEVCFFYVNKSGVIKEILQKAICYLDDRNTNQIISDNIKYSFGILAHGHFHCHSWPFTPPFTEFALGPWILNSLLKFIRNRIASVW